MKLSTLLKHLNKLAEEPENLKKYVTVTGCYASDGDILSVYIGKSDSCYGDESIILASDICSG